jgi:hypothetical protein
MTDDLKQRLERLADRAGDGPVGLEGLRAARSRKARNQRVGAGLLAVVVAVAGTVTAMTAFRDRVDDPTVPSGAAWTPPEVLTVWPENPVRGETPESVQAAVDAGDESLAWRLDPEKVAFHYARSFLAWDDPLVEEQGIGTTTPVYVISPCGPTVDCTTLGASPTLALTLVQPVTNDGHGIWSVTAVRSEPLRIDLQSEDDVPTLAFDSSVPLDAELPDYRSAHAGIVVANGCEEAFEFEANIPASATLPVPAAENLDPSCGRVGAGYAFIYAMDDTTEPTGDPLLEAAAIEFPWLTIVPVYVEMQPGDTVTATPSPVRDALGIMCSTDGSLSLSATVVAATTAGVVVSTGAEYPYYVRFDKDERYGAGDYATLSLSLPPGTHEVRCIRREGEIVSDPAVFEVVDPNGYWVDPELDCDSRSGTDYDAGPLTIEGDPSDALLASGESLIRGVADVSEAGSFVFGGYPESRGSRWVVLQGPDGSVVARIEFTQSGQDWYPDHSDTCDGMIIF